MLHAVNYDRVAAGYDRRYTENQYTGIESVLDEFVDPGQAVLEVGCGTGHWVARLRSRRCAVVGLDPSSGMLSRAMDQVGDAMLVRGRAEALPFQAGSFDRIVVINALHHFTDPAAFAKQARRVIRPGGRIVVMGLDPSRGPDELTHSQSYQPPLELRMPVPVVALPNGVMPPFDVDHINLRR